MGAIRGQDHATLSQIPGIGKRLAERLVVDLKDKLEDMAAAPQQVETGPSTEDVLSALVNLGYQRPLAQKAIAAAVAKDKTVGDNLRGSFPRRSGRNAQLEQFRNCPTDGSAEQVDFSQSRVD